MTHPALTLIQGGQASERPRTSEEIRTYWDAVWERRDREARDAT